MPIGRAMLVAMAVERGEEYESRGAGKASPQDLNQYVCEIVLELHHNEGTEIPGNVIAAALFEIWDDGGIYSVVRTP